MNFSLDLSRVEGESGPGTARGRGGGGGSQLRSARDYFSIIDEENSGNDTYSSPTLSSVPSYGSELEADDMREVLMPFFTSDPDGGGFGALEEGGSNDELREAMRRAQKLHQSRKGEAGAGLTEDESVLARSRSTPHREGQGRSGNDSPRRSNSSDRLPVDHHVPPLRTRTMSVAVGEGAAASFSMMSANGRGGGSSNGGGVRAGTRSAGTSPIGSPRGSPPMARENATEGTAGDKEDGTIPRGLARSNSSTVLSSPRHLHAWERSPRLVGSSPRHPRRSMSVAAESPKGNAGNSGSPRSGGGGPQLMRTHRTIFSRTSADGLVMRSAQRTGSRSAEETPRGEGEERTRPKSMTMSMTTDELMAAAARRVEDIRKDKRSRKSASKEQVAGAKLSDLSQVSLDLVCECRRTHLAMYDAFCEFSSSSVRLRQLPFSPEGRTAIVVPCDASLEVLLRRSHPSTQLIIDTFGENMIDFMRETVMHLFLGEMTPGVSILFRPAAKAYIVLTCVALTNDVASVLPLYTALRSALLLVRHHNHTINKATAPPAWSPPDSGLAQKAPVALRRIAVMPFPPMNNSRRALASALAMAYRGVSSSGVQEMIQSQYLTLLRDSLRSLGQEHPKEKEKEKEERKEKDGEEDRARLLSLMERGLLARRGLADVHEALMLLKMFYSSDKTRRAAAMRCFEELLSTSGRMHRDLPFALKRPQLCSCIAMDKRAFQELLQAAQSRELNIHTEIQRGEVKLFDKIGRGGTANVHLAEWNGFECAFKEYHEVTDKTEFLREASIMSVICHPNLIRLIGSSSADEPSPFLLMELADGGSLSQLLYETDTELPPERMMLIAVQACRAVSYLHNLGLVHRDIKSENVLLAANGVVKLSDYGTARLLSTDRTMTGNIGTTYWMAPEVFAEEAYTEKADVYSLGMLLYEVFARAIPFNDVSTFRIPMMVTKGKRPAIPDHVPKQVGKLIEQCWHGKPGKRPSMEKLVQSLEGLLQSARAN